MDRIFIDLGLHLNEKGTRIWQATIKAARMAQESVTRRRTTQTVRTNERAARSNTEPPHSSAGELIP